MTNTDRVPCATNRCYNLGVLTVSLGESGKEKWRCESCYNALLEGSKVEYHDIKVTDYAE